MKIVKQYYCCVRACRYQKNIIKTVVFVLGRTVRLLLKAVFQNTRYNLQLNINQKSFIFQVKFGLNPLVSMELKMILPSTIYNHVVSSPYKNNNIKKVYIVKLGFTGVDYFSYFCSKIDCDYS